MTQQQITTKPRFIETELGTEKLCIECNEYWPLDTEFWYLNKVKTKKKGVVLRVIAACKDCYVVRYKPHRLLSKQKNIERTGAVHP